MLVKRMFFIIGTNVFVKCPTIISEVGKYKVAIHTTVLGELDDIKLVHPTFGVMGF